MDLTRLANDEVAGLVARYPDRFAAGIAAVALNNPDGTLVELERAITELKFRGVQLYTDFVGKPLDSPEFMPIYEMMARYNLPISSIQPQESQRQSTGVKISPST